MTRATLPAREGVCFRRVRIHGHADDVPLVDRNLRLVDVHPRGIPPSAILFVRRLSDVRPGCVGDRHSTQGALVDWAAQQRTELERIAQQAARPVRLSVPASANAVLFADEVEWLTYATAQSCRRDVYDSAWWAPELVRDDDTLRVCWLQRPRLVPATLELVAAHGFLRDAVHRLGYETHALLSCAILDEFGADVPTATATTFLGRTVAAAPTGAVRFDRIGDAPAAPPTWAALVPELVAVTPPARRFVLLALLARRRPLALMQAGFRDELDRWLPESDSTPSARPSEKLEVTRHFGRLAGRDPDYARRVGSRRLDGDRAAADEVVVDPPARHEAAATAAPDTDTGATCHSVPTAFGGLFYLLNAMLVAGIYGDFTNPVLPVPAVDPWRLLDRLGAALDDPAWPDDPIVLLLDELSCIDDPVMSRAKRDRWVAHAIAEITRHIARAFGTNDPIESIRDMARVPADINVTPAHVDVRFALDAIRVDVRVAGLDRDPGWIPASGRIVAFHYD